MVLWKASWLSPYPYDPSARRLWREDAIRSGHLDSDSDTVISLQSEPGVSDRIRFLICEPGARTVQEEVRPAMYSAAHMRVRRRCLPMHLLLSRQHLRCRPMISFSPGC